MYLVSGSFAALTMANPTLVAAMVQDEAAVAEDGVTTSASSPMTDEQQAIYDMWPADKQSAFMAWPAETQGYFWSLSAERQDLFWRLTDDNKISLTAMGPEDQASAWQMIEARAAAVEGEEPAPEARARSIPSDEAAPPEPQSQVGPMPESRPEAPAEAMPEAPAEPTVEAMPEAPAAPMPEAEASPQG